MNKSNTPQIRFNGFSEDWVERSINEVLTEEARSIQLIDDTSYELVTVKRRNEGIVSRGFLKGKDILVKNYFKVQAGDFLISKRQVIHGANGIVPKSLNSAIVSNEYLVIGGNEDISADFWALIAKNPEMYKKFLLSSYGVDIEKMVFSVSDWRSRNVTLPKISEQTAIGNFFQNIDQNIALKRQKYQQTQTLKKALLSKMFPKAGHSQPEIRLKGFSDDWFEMELGNISSVFSGGTPSVGHSEYYGGKIPFIRSGEVSSSTTELFLTEEGLLNSSAKLVSTGDILYALYGATSGEVSISNINGAINQAVLAIIPSNEYNAEFIAYWLRMNKGNIVNTYLQGGQGNLSGGIIKSLLIKISPLFEEQTAIGEFFKQLDETLTLQAQQLKTLETIKKALLAKMFV